MNNTELEYRLTELERRLANVVRDGTVIEVDLPAGRVRVQYDTDAEGNAIKTDWLPWYANRAGTDADWWPPEVGEQVSILSPRGDLAQGRVLPALYSTEHPAPADSADVRRIEFGDGAFIEYDRAAHHLRFVLPAGGTTEWVTDGGMSIKGDQAVEGSVTATVDITAEGEVSDTEGTMSRLRENYNTATYIGNLGSPTSTTSKVDA